MSSIEALLARGRSVAESLMTDTCWVRRAGTPTTNSTTGAVTPAWSDVYGTLVTPAKCRVQQGAAGEGQVEAGQHESMLAGLIVSLPLSATGIVPGDQVVIGASAHDDDLVDRVLTVIRVLSKSHATARRLWCEEVQA